MTVLLDPFQSVAVEHFDLTVVRQQLKDLPDLDVGLAWNRPASLSRFGLTEMNYRMQKRFFAKVEPVDLEWDDRFGPCWIWQGGLHDKGYGRFYLGKDPVDDSKIWAYSHRISFEHFIGIPKPGYIVDHRCNVKTCCNPVHLQPVTNAENLILAQHRRPWKRRNQYSKE